jgi:hypothetical protein
MNSQTATIEKICLQRNEIAAFIDGELLPHKEFELELHLAVCGFCATELNEQKKLLCALDYALENEKQIELPANFTKVVVTNAESKVDGLRRPQERSKALFVCAALFVLVILGLGGETKTVLNTFGKFAEQFLAVGGFVWNLIYDVSVGTAIVLRSLGSQFIFNSSAFFAILIVFVFLSLFLLLRFISAQRS